jgi:hypothetical protein
VADRGYPSLAGQLQQQLSKIPPSRDGGIEYRPCRVTLDDGTERDCVLLVNAADYIAYWGVWPEDDPYKRSVRIERVASIHESTRRLPARCANALYEAGETGMGYFVFTVVLGDGRRLPFVTGNVVDFPALPPDVATTDVVEVLPHVGLDAFRHRVPTASEGAADYAWCLYSDISTRETGARSGSG